MSETESKQIVWSIHGTHPEFVQPLRASLAQVVDPEIGMNIIQLGMVREVKIIDDIVKIHMILTTPFCPYGPAMIETTRKKAQEVFKLPVTVEMDMDMWDFSMMEDPSGLDWGMYM
jgi:metal-sulfur cluster biosynthetic enzyme